VSTIAENLESVRARIRSAAAAAGRGPDDVKLLAVSKMHPAAAIREAYAAGQRAFGENYAQELEDKARDLADLADIEWHFIGHLQRNKAKVVARAAHVVHTVDSRELARELGKRAAAAGFGASRGSMPVYAEVNAGGESQKSGVSPDALGAVLDAIDGEAALHLVGLMTVPPHGEDATRAAFAKVVELRDALGGPARLPELSMGMTSDLEIAVEMGATLVRIGTAIFGERPAR
jgi:PLP dependent protein